MKDRNFKRDYLFVFVAINYTLSILLSLFIGLTGGHESRFISLSYVSMFIPAITVLLMTAIFKAPVNKFDWNRVPVKWIIPALFLMPVVIHAVCLPLLTILNNASLPWQGWLHADNHGLYHVPADKGWGTLTGGELVIKVIVNALTGVIIVSVLAFFEEIGWRAWMLPRLIKKFNVKKGVLIGAFIWALWHVPLYLAAFLTLIMCHYTQRC
jgi:membrane protease YdiL (CAAX protease family)